MSIPCALHSTRPDVGRRCSRARATTYGPAVGGAHLSTCGDDAYLHSVPLALPCRCADCQSCEWKARPTLPPDQSSDQWHPDLGPSALGKPIRLSGWNSRDSQLFGSLFACVPPAELQCISRISKSLLFSPYYTTRICSIITSMLCSPLVGQLWFRTCLLHTTSRQATGCHPNKTWLLLRLPDETVHNLAKQISATACDAVSLRSQRSGSPQTVRPAASGSPSHSIDTGLVPAKH